MQKKSASLSPAPASMGVLLGKTLLLLVLVGFSNLLSAQNETTLPKTWTLQACLDYALENNLQVQQNNLTIESNRSTLKQAQLDRLPSLNANISHFYNFGRSLNPFTNQFINQQIQTNNLSLSGDVTIFSGFSINNTIKQNKLNVESSEFSLEEAKNNLKLNLINAYLQVVLNQQILENAQKQSESTKAQIEQTRRLVTAGTLPEVNLYQLEAQFATDKVQIVQAQNSINLAKLTLKQLMQLPAQTQMELVVPQMVAPSESLEERQLEAIFSAAENSQPQVKAARLGTQSSLLGIEISKARLLPTLSFGFQANTNYSSANKTLPDLTKEPIFSGIDTLGYIPDASGLPQDYVVRPRFSLQEKEFGFFSQIREAFRQGFGFSLQIPIFNRFQTRNAIQQATIRAKQSEVNEKIVINQLRQTIEQAYLDARASEASYRANLERVKALQEAFRASEKRYELGAANLTDYTLAKNNLAAAENDLLRAQYDFIFKVKVLDFYQGKPLEIE
ncbi:TolC family protein [Hugenholtzia roseola]|uniref:TolC family protein n=1 Tax=Hugenholtzia roseola TaxID=1002 RepID=UPI0012B53935|nr:TolC family protein [Hugenholtzia roseola]